jgi:hypothetical protein
MGGYESVGRGGGVGRSIGLGDDSNGFLLEGSYFVKGCLGCATSDNRTIKKMGVEHREVERP